MGGVSFDMYTPGTMFHPGGTSGGTATLLHVTVLAVRRNPEGGLSHSAMSRKTPGTNVGRGSDPCQASF